MGRPIKKGSTDQSTVIRILDSTTFLPENAVEHNTAGIDLWWRREQETKTSITEAALAALDSAHSDGGIELIGDGYYRLDLPDAAVAAGSGENSVQIGGTITGMIVIGNEHALVDYDPYDSVRAGLTALPNANADAGGGLPISDDGGLDMDSILEKMLAYMQLLARSDAAIETDNATELTAINADGGSGAGDFSSQTDAEEAIKDALDSGVDLTHIQGTAINETSAGRIAGNFNTFWDNADAATAKTVDDVGAASGGGSSLVLGAGDVGDFKKDGVVHFFWNTIDRSGAAVAPSTAGTLRVYKDDGTGEVTAPTGITDTRAFDGVTGLQECKIDLSASSFYAKEKNYSAILVGAVIDTKTVNVKVGSFSIENRWANVHFHYGGK